MLYLCFHNLCIGVVGIETMKCIQQFIVLNKRCVLNILCLFSANSVYLVMREIGLLSIFEVERVVSLVFIDSSSLICEALLFEHFLRILSMLCSV